MPFWNLLALLLNFAMLPSWGYAGVFWCRSEFPSGPSETNFLQGVRRQETWKTAGDELVWHEAEKLCLETPCDNTYAFGICFESFDLLSLCTKMQRCRAHQVHNIFTISWRHPDWTRSDMLKIDKISNYERGWVWRRFNIIRLSFEFWGGPELGFASLWRCSQQGPKWAGVNRSTFWVLALDAGLGLFVWKRFHVFDRVLKQIQVYNEL